LTNADQAEKAKLLMDAPLLRVTISPNDETDLQQPSQVMIV
jgi:hypothetical protein